MQVQPLVPSLAFAGPDARSTHTAAWPDTSAGAAERARAISSASGSGVGREGYAFGIADAAWPASARTPGPARATVRMTAAARADQPCRRDRLEADVVCERLRMASS